MTYFPLKKTHIFLPPSIQPQIGNCYPQYIRYGQTDGRTDERDDNGTIDAYSITVIFLKNASKIVLGNESSKERKFHLWNVRSRERKFSGTKVPVTLLTII